jgi:RHS repeat-associated protein
MKRILQKTISLMLALVFMVSMISVLPAQASAVFVGAYRNGDAHNQPTSTTFRDQPAFSGGVLAGGNIIFAPSHSSRIGIYNPVSGTYRDGAAHGIRGSAFSGAVLAADGRVILIPYFNEFIGIYNPASDNYINGDRHYRGQGAFIGGVLAPNGNIILIPELGNNFGIYNPSTDTFTNGPSHGLGDFAFSGGVLAPDGRIIMIPSTQNRVGIYDPATNSFALNPTNLGTAGGFRGGVLLPCGHIVFIPRNNSVNIGVFRPWTNQLFSIPHNRDISGSGNIFIGGVVTLDGRVLLIPERGSRFVIFDLHATNMFTDGDSHTQVGGRLSEPLGGGAFSGGVLAPNGDVILVPYYAPRVGVYTPPAHSRNFRNVHDIDDCRFIRSSDGDPIDMVSGNFYWDYTDFSLHGANPLEFIRYYNSKDTRSGELGVGWRHNYMYSATVEGTFVRLTMPDGEQIIFNHLGNLNFAPAHPTDKKLSIVANTDFPHLGIQTITLVEDRDYTWYVFDFNSGHLLLIDYLDGRRDTITRNPSNPTRINTISNRSGTFTFRYDTNGRIDRVTDHTGRFVSYAYNANGELVTVTNADNDTLGYKYQNSRVAEITDFNGNLYLSNTYDEVGRVLSQYMLGQGTFGFEYDFINRITAITDPNGAVRRYHFNSQEQVTAFEDDDGKIEYKYNSNGRLVEIKDPLGNVTEYGYDNNGNRTLVKYPDGTTEVFKFEHPWHPWLMTETIWRDDSKTVYEHDDRGNVITITFTKGTESNVRRFQYDSNNSNLIRYTDATGIVTNFLDYDARGNYRRMTDADNNTLMRFEYNNLGRLTAQITATGERTEFEYSPAGSLIKTTQIHPTDPSKNIIQEFDHNGNGYIETETDAEGNVTKTVYDEMNNPFSVTDPEGNTVFYKHDEVGNLREVTEAVKNAYNSSGVLLFTENQLNALKVTSFEYDHAGRLISRTDFNNNTWEYRYNANGQLTRIIDPYLNPTVMDYDEMGNLDFTINARDARTEFEYDNLGRVRFVTDALNGITEYRYDINGNVNRLIDARNNTWQYKFDNEGRLEESIDPELNRTTYRYNALGQLERSIIHLGNCAANCQGTATDAVYRFTYDAAGRLKTETDPKGHVFENFYDVFGRLERRKNNTDNTEITFEYFDNGWLKSATDENQIKTSYTYYGNGLVKDIRKTQGGVTVTEAAYEYCANGWLRFATNRHGSVTEYRYDNNGNVRFVINEVTSTNEQGNPVQQNIRTEYVYDALNRVKAIIDPEKGRTDFKFDASGNIEEITDAEGHTESFEYDLLDRLILHTDKNGNDTQFKHDANGNVIEVIDALNHSSFFEYDALNRLTKARLFRGTEEQVTQYHYDPRGLLVKTINAAGHEKEYRYDLNGNLRYIKDEDGNETVFEHNSQNRIKSILYDDGRLAEFRYDPAGRLEEVEDWTGTTTFELDLLGRIKSVNDSNGNLTGYTYNDVLNTVTIAYPDDSVVKQSFDEVNRLTSVKDGDDNLITSYTYDTASRLERLVRGNGTVERYEYDAIGQLTHVFSGNQLLRETKYDANGNITEEEGVSFGYDALNRLTSAGNNTFQYDSLGNLTRSVEGGVTTTYTYNNLNQQLTRTSGGTTVTSTFDNRGNLTASAGSAFVYDATNRMIHGTNAQGDISEYIFNGLGYLVETRQNGIEQVTVLDYTSPFKNVIMEITEPSWLASLDFVGTTTPAGETPPLPQMGLQLLEGDWQINRYVHGLGLASVTVDEEIFYTHLDRLGSVRSMTDSTGAVVHSVSYDAWGRPSGDVEWAKYTVHAWDDVLGLYFAQARMYDAENRRFMAIDPVKDGLNWYAYCGNNPMTFIDPTGLFFTKNQREWWGDLFRYSSADIKQHGVGGWAGEVFSGGFEGWAEGCAMIMDGMNGPNAPALIGTTGTAGGVAAKSNPITGAVAISAAGVLAIWSWGAMQHNPSATLAPPITLAPPMSLPMPRYRDRFDPCERDIPDTRRDVIPAPPPPRSGTVIYRWGGTNPSNLTPRAVDVGSGLSFSTVPKSGAAMTTIQAVNATGILSAVKDGATHVTVTPVGATVADWYNAGSTSMWTAALTLICVRVP